IPRLFSGTASVLLAVATRQQGRHPERSEGSFLDHTSPLTCCSLVMVFHVNWIVHHGRVRMFGLECSDFGFMNERKTDLVETFEQRFASEGIDLEKIAETGIVADDLLLQINCEAVAFLRFSTAEELINLFRL